MEPILEQLCSRIYDIQMCIEYAVNNGAETKRIQEMSAQMSQIEHELELVEEEVEAQMPLIKGAEDIITQLENIHDTCNDLPKQNGFQYTEKKTITAPNLQTQARIPSIQTKTAIPNIVPKLVETNNSKAAVNFNAIQHVTKEEAKKNQYRISAEKINQFIDEINAILEKKAKLLALGSKEVKQSDVPWWESVKAEEFEGIGLCVNNLEIESRLSSGFKGNLTKMLISLKELDRITQVTYKKGYRLFPKN